MLCRNKKCKAELLDGAKFCHICGKEQEPKRKSNRRPNLCGTIVYRENRKKPYHVYGPPDKQAYGKRPFIGAFSTKPLAEQAIREFNYAPADRFNITLDELHSEWEKLKAYTQLSKSMKDGYQSAWYKLRAVKGYKVRDLRTAHMQTVIDYYECEHQMEGTEGKLLYIDKDGKRTFEKTDKPLMCEGLSYSSLSKIKCLLTSMYEYAIKNDIVNKNYAEFLELPKKVKSAKDRFTDLEVDKIEKNKDTVPYADYILCMCYTGFRIAEFLSLTKFSVREEGDIMYLVGGIKTEAGRNRPVPVHSKISPIIKERLAANGKTLFCKKDGSAMSQSYFRDKCYYPALEQMGLPKMSPHATRRTFSTKASAAGIREEDLIAMMGHTDIKTDRESYIIQEIKTLKSSIEKIS